MGVDLSDFVFFFKPCNFILNSLCAGTGGIAEFLFCLAVVKSVVSCKVINGEGGHKGLFAAFLCAVFSKFCNSVCKPDGKEHLDGLASAFRNDYFAEFFKGDLCVCKDVAFAVAAFFRSKDSSVCKVANVGKVEGTVDAGGHFAFDDFDKSAGGFAYGEVLRAENAAGMNNAGMKSALFACVKNMLGGFCLGLAVAVDKFFRMELGNFFDGSAFGKLRDSAGGAAVKVSE